eukprot:6182202-Pleurochrysis_carterae.AAC.1
MSTEAITYLLPGTLLSIDVPLSQASLLPYLGFLYFMSYPKNRTPNTANFGFQVAVQELTRANVWNAVPVAVCALYCGDGYRDQDRLFQASPNCV